MTWAASARKECGPQGRGQAWSPARLGATVQGDLTRHRQWMGPGPAAHMGALRWTDSQGWVSTLPARQRVRAPVTPSTGGTVQWGLPSTGRTQAYFPGTSGSPLSPVATLSSSHPDPAERGSGGLCPVPGNPVILRARRQDPRRRLGRCVSGGGQWAEQRAGTPSGCLPSALACSLAAALLQWGPLTKAVRMCGSQGRAWESPGSSLSSSSRSLDLPVGAGLVAWRDPRS